MVYAGRAPKVEDRFMPDEKDPKVLIDEDWKSRVAREKEEARKAAESGEKPSPDAGASAEKAKEPASPFLALVTYLASHAAGAMGLFAAQDAEEIPVNLEMARFVIDGLMTLREKTKGNLTPEEEGQLRRFTADLQNAYVGCSEAVQETAMRGAQKGPEIVRP